MSTSRPAPAAVLGRVRTSYPRLLRILVPLDFSGRSRLALRYAVPVAQRFSARIHLVHVLPAAPRGDLPARREAARERLEQLAARLLPPPLRTAPTVAAGDPAREILAAATRLDADLIVLAAKAGAGLRRLLRRGTAEHVLRHARCPVLSVRRR